MNFDYMGANLSFDPNSIIGSHTNYSYTPQQQQAQPQQSQPQPLTVDQLSMQRQLMGQMSMQPQQQFQQQQQQQSYGSLPQFPNMQPFLRQFLMQPQSYSYQGESGQMSPNAAMGGRSGSAYGSDNESFGQINNLAPFNKNALNFGY